MKTKTVKLYGYEVTGKEEIVTDIENSFNSRKNSDFSWENLYENDVIYVWNGEGSYSVTIDHENKKVLASEPKIDEWITLKVGDRVESVSDGLKGVIVEDKGFDYGIQLDDGKHVIIEGRKLSRMK